jgi:hypothetical protein
MWRYFDAASAFGICMKIYKGKSFRLTISHEQEGKTKKLKQEIDLSLL